MGEIEVVLALLVLVTALAALARRLPIPDPILLVLAGLAIGLVPGLPHVELEPDLVFLLFLPPIIYSAAYFTSIRDFRANLRPILLLSVGLVLFSAVVVAVVAHTLVPGLPWAAAFAVGAIVSPPDAVAATAVFQRLGVPRRIVTILEGESLVNDATALVALRTAVVAVGGTFSIVQASVDVVVASAGGIAIGLVIGRFATTLLRRIEDPVLGTVLSLLVPVTAFLPAEQAGVSGVLAVVTAGLLAGRQSARDLTSAQRLQGHAAWEIVLFLVNGLVFVLIGLQLPVILGELGQPLLQATAIAVGVSLAAVAARFAWVFATLYLPRRLRARPASAASATRDATTAGEAAAAAAAEAREATDARSLTLVAWAGMRGVISLAAALTLPFDFPGRALILFLTFGVILATLVVQGLTLPLLVRLLGLREDGEHDAEERLARRHALEAAIDRIGQLEREWPGHRELIDQLRTQYLHRAEHLGEEEADEETLDELQQELFEHRRIRHEIIVAERSAVIRLRDRGEISDEALRRIERDLDLEELRLEA